MGLQKKIFLIVLGFLISTILLFSALQAYFKWSEQYYFGRILELNESGFVIVDGENRGRVIVIGPDTIIKKGPRTLQNELAIGTEVIVAGSLNELGEIKAGVIRIVERRGPGSR